MNQNSKNTLIALLDPGQGFTLDLMENGIKTKIGDSGDTDNRFVLKVNNRRFYDQLLAYGNLGMGEAFMRGEIELLKGSWEDFIESLLAMDLEKKLLQKPRLLLKIAGFRFQDWVAGSQKNIRQHYDIGIEVFRTFLDASLTYSCGYAIREEDDLEQLQHNKFDRICRKLELKNKETLLDIGCGYGGLLIYAAENFGIEGMGVTNSRNHYTVGNELIRVKGLEKKIKIELTDFRKVSGTFDKIASVGMLEHVPENQYVSYFSMVDKLLKKWGRGLLHFVGSNTHTNTHDYFIQKYIFPMSSQPKLSVVISCLEKNNLPILDVENMIRHYGYTAQHWVNNFRKNKHLLTGYDEKFKKMFEYYLACCVAASKASDAALYQVLFMKNHRGRIDLKRV